MSSDAKQRVAAVLASMHTNVADARAQADGCEALRSLSFNNAANKAIIASAGGAETIVAGMRAHAARADVQESGCAALNNLAFGSDENKALIVSAGGVEAVVAGMRAHTSVAIVQAYGNATLQSFAVLDANCARIASAGGIEAVVAGLRAHTGDATVQANGYGALCNLASDDANCARVASAGSLDAIVAGMRAHAANATVQAKACSALNNISANHNAIKASVASAGGVAAIITSMSAYVSHEDVQANACVALRNLATLEANRALIASAGGVGATVAAMRAHPANASIQESGCSVFDDLSAIEANRPLIANSGGLEALRAAMSAHSSVTTICTWGKRAVNRCAEHTEAARAEALRAQQARDEVAKRDAARLEAVRAQYLADAKAKTEAAAEQARIAQQQSLAEAQAQIQAQLAAKARAEADAARVAAESAELERTLRELDADRARTEARQLELRRRVEAEMEAARKQAELGADAAAAAAIESARAEQARERALILAAEEERRRQLESDRVAAHAAAETARREAERAQMAKDAVDAAIASRDRGALADAVSIASGMSVSDSAADGLQKSLVVAARLLAYLQLREAKPKHSAWSCAEVRAAFEALVSVHSLAADSSAAVIKYLADETVDGALLSVLAADADILKELVPNSLRRHRLTAVLSEMCADPVGAAKAPVAVPVAAASAPWSVPVAAATAAAGIASPHAVSATSFLSNDEERHVVSPVGARLLLSDAEFDLVTNPITGFISAPLLSLRDAVRATGIKVPASCIELASEHHENMEFKCAHGLTSDEIGALHLYTQECPLYHELNALLRSRDRATLKPCLPFMRLLVGAMHKLPKHAGRVFRGMTRHLADTAGEDKRGWPLDQIFPIGKKFVWWAASSTSLSIKTLEAFAGKVGRRTVFSISAKHAVDVMAYSAFGALEKEWVLAPGTKLRVTGVADLGDVAMVELEEIGVPYTLMDFADEE